MVLPDVRLPRFPKVRGSLTSSLSSGGREVLPVGRDVVVERESIAGLVERRRSGGELVVDRSGPVVRFHGCRACPWYGSTFCFEKVVPPGVYEFGICQGRLGEVLDAAELCGSSDGLVVRKTEAVERLRLHVHLLEANLADHRVRRLALAEKKRADGPPKDKDGRLKMSVEEWDLKLSEIDAYEVELQKQIEVLSLKYAEFLQADERLAKEKGLDVPRSLNIQQLNVLLADSVKKLDKQENGGGG